MRAEQFLDRLDGVRSVGPDRWSALCPSHEDRQNSLSVRATVDRILVNCFAGCTAEKIVEVLGLALQDLFFSEDGRPVESQRAMLRLEDFAAAKGLPVDFLLEHGVVQDGAAVRIAYRLRDGEPAIHQRRRTALAAKDGSSWLGPHGEPLVAYGLWRLDDAQDRGELLLVEGETDTLTAWLHQVPCLGIPGSSLTKVLTAESLAGIERLWVVREPDKAGADFVAGIAQRLRDLGWTGQAGVIRLPVKDLNDLHRTAGADFASVLSQAQVHAEPLERALAIDAAQTSSAPDGAAIVVRSIADSLRRKPDELVVRYLLRPFIPEGGLTALSGAPGVSKGKFVEDLMLARATGQPFLGQEVTPGPSLFWSGEQGADEDDRVFQAFARRRGITPAAITHPLFVLSDPTSHVNHPAMRDRVLELARQHPGLLISLDSIRRAFPGDENESETPDRFFRDFVVPLRTFGATVLFLAHPPKPPAQGELRPESLLRGSADWLAILDSFLVLKASGRQRLDVHTEEIHSTLLHVKARRGPRADEGTLTLHVTDDETPNLGFAFSFTAGGTEVTKAQVAIEALAAFYRERGRAGRREYLEAFAARFSERQLDPARKMLVAQVLLKEVAGGAGKASVWAWSDGNTGVDGSLPFDQEPDDVPR